MKPTFRSVAQGRGTSFGANGFRAAAVWCAVAACCLVSLGCAKTSESRELDHDISRDTIAGPLPTAPPSTEYTGPGLSSDATEMLRELRELERERDMCEVITSRTLRNLLSGEVELAGMVTTPSGIAQMIAAIDTFLQHLTDISPPEIAPSTAAVVGAWRGVASIPSDASDREARTREIVEAPEITTAVENLKVWIQSNCIGSTSPQFDLGGLLGAGLGG